MRLVHRREVIDSAPSLWEKQYSCYSNMPDKIAIMHKLNALVLPILREDVDAIIGNGSWTQNLCDECQGDFETLVRIGSEPDYDRRWQDLCVDCLAKALALATSPDAPLAADPARRG